MFVCFLWYFFFTSFYSSNYLSPTCLPQGHSIYSYVYVYRSHVWDHSVTMPVPLPKLWALSVYSCPQPLSDLWLPASVHCSSLCPFCLLLWEYHSFPLFLWSLVMVEFLMNQGTSWKQRNEPHHEMTYIWYQYLLNPKFQDLRWAGRFESYLVTNPWR